MGMLYGVELVAIEPHILFGGCRIKYIYAELIYLLAWNIRHYYTLYFLIHNKHYSTRVIHHLEAGMNKAIQ